MGRRPRLQPKAIVFEGGDGVDFAGEWATPPGLSFIPKEPSVEVVVVVDWI
jgi:hypothetical protein